jgi:hypothetical protein
VEDSRVDMLVLLSTLEELGGRLGRSVCKTAREEETWRRRWWRSSGNERIETASPSHCREFFAVLGRTQRQYEDEKIDIAGSPPWKPLDDRGNKSFEALSRFVFSPSLSSSPWHGFGGFEADRATL